MINDSLLETLASLRAFDKKLFVAENFLTAAFAYLLKNDRSFLRTYLKDLGYRCSALPEVQIQKTHGIASGNIPDMVFSDRHTYIIQENKIDAPIGKNQLRRYPRQVRNSKKRIKGLVYVRRKQRLRHSMPDSISGIRIRRRTWDKIASLVKSSPETIEGTPTWLREEFFKFLEAHRMTLPTAINIHRLKTTWKHFESQSNALKRMIEESSDALQKVLGNTKCRIRIPHSAVNHPGFYITTTNGRRLKKAMRDQDLWVWCGIYPWGDEIYAGVEIGWGEKYEQAISSTFRNRLERKGFEHYAEPNDPKYPYEAYSFEKPLSGIIGSSNNFEKQTDRAAQWFKDRAKVLIRLLASLERLI